MPSLPWQATQVWPAFGAVPTARPVGFSSWPDEERRDVLHVLLRQRRCLRVHRRVRPFLGLVPLERDDHVGGVLAAELRHAVNRKGVLVILDAVAAVAGVGELGAARRVRRPQRGQARRTSRGSGSGRARPISKSLRRLLRKRLVRLRPLRGRRAGHVNKKCFTSRIAASRRRSVAHVSPRLVARRRAPPEPTHGACTHDDLENGLLARIALRAVDSLSRRSPRRRGRRGCRAR